MNETALNAIQGAAASAITQIAEHIKISICPSGPNEMPNCLNLGKISVSISKQWERDENGHRTGEYHYNAWASAKVSYTCSGRARSPSLHH